MAIDWNIISSPGPVDISGNFARGYQMGSAILDKIHERNALGTLARDPDNQSALAALYQVNPQMGAHFEERGQQLRTANRRSSILQQYATDPNAARTAAVSAGDFDLVGELGKLDDTQGKRASSFWSKAGPIAYQLKQIKDPAQRQALWAQAKPILQSEAADPSLIEHFDPTNDTQLDAAIATSQTIGDFIEQNKVHWVQQGESPSFAVDSMGRPTGSANPAGSGNLPKVATPQDAMKLPPGSHFELPDGRIGTVPGGATGNPSPTFR